MRMILNCIDKFRIEEDTGVSGSSQGLGECMRLVDMNIGDKARIIKINLGEKAYRQRLMSMGLLPGTEFVVSRMAPLGDPVEITVRGYTLSLRKGEANILQIERLTE